MTQAGTKKFFFEKMAEIGKTDFFLLLENTLCYQKNIVASVANCG